MNAQENEKEAVRTTIVGGRPPGSGRNTGSVPKGIEVLVKKAAVDPEFCELLLERRGEAAAIIELALDPAEAVMLAAIPRLQLAQIIAQTQVPVEQRRVFLGKVAAAMLAALGVGAVATGCIQGSRPDDPQPQATNQPVTYGIQPDRPVQSSPPQIQIYTNGIRPDLPPPAGIRPDPPKPATNPPPTRGIQPDRPPGTSTNSPVSQGTRP